MATPSITQAEFKAVVNGMLHGKFSQCQDPTVVMNRAVRFVVGDMDLRSHKRSAALSPNMFANQYDYAAPSDLKGEKLIDFRKQVNRPSGERWLLCDESEFDRKKASSPYRVAVRDENFAKLLRVAGVDSDVSITLNKLDSLTGNGTWAASGDASNITLDENEYINGAAFNFDTASGATTAVLSTSSMSQVDLSTWDEQGSVFMWVFVPDSVDLTKLTNFILRWGNDSTNYWSKTVTTGNDGNSFKLGWNLLRFDWSTATESVVGGVNPAAIDYLHFTVTKATNLAADTDWRIDEIIFRKGDRYDTVYYSKFGWQTTAGVYIEESTTTTDLIVGDTDEIEMIASKCAEFGAQELKEWDDLKIAKMDYKSQKETYESKNPSEALKKRRDYGMQPRFNRHRF